MSSALAARPVPLPAVGLRARALASRAARPLSAAGLLATLLLTSTARGYVRTTVDGDATIPLWWPDRTLEYRVAFDTFVDQNPQAAELAVRHAFDTWALAEQAGGRCTDLEFLGGGQPQGYNTNLYGSVSMGDGQNIIVWRDDAPPFMDPWPPPPRGGEAPVDPNALAVTTLVYRRSTGEIVDADIDLNAVNFYWTVADTDVVTDLQNTLTHEIGHFIGFAHTTDPESTMYASSPPGELKKRDLTDDDIEGLCTVYPYGSNTPGAPGRTSSGLSSPTLRGESCSSAGGSAPAGVASSLPALAALLLCRRRRRGHRHRP